MKYGGYILKQILMNNALESWMQAIHYCDEIRAGKATLGNRKNYVSSLQNSIELFIKQYMLNICDHRVSGVREMDSDVEPMRTYLSTNDLNRFFYDLQKNDKASMRKFFSAEFKDLINWQKKLFEDYYNKYPSSKNVVCDGLKALKELRNNETHFYIDEFEFLSEKEFVKLYNLMVDFFKILVHYHLFNIWRKGHLGKITRIEFYREPLSSSFSYKKQLKNSKYVAILKDEIEKRVFPSGCGDDAYMISQDIVSVCENLGGLKFDELWAYVQMLLKYNMLIINDDADEDVIDGEKVFNPYREYRIEL